MTMNVYRNIGLNVCCFRGTRVYINLKCLYLSSYQKYNSRVSVERNMFGRLRCSANLTFLTSSLKRLLSSVHSNKIALNIPPALLYSTVNNSLKVCWNCKNGVKSNLFFCESCGVLQPVNKHKDLFQIIGVNRSYRGDNAELRQKYRSLQALLHPDKFSSKHQREQELSEEFSSVVNKAYATLSDPLERGLYLLGLHGASIEEGTTDIDKMFLMEIMERNEEIENETDPQKLKEFYANNKDQFDALTSKVGEAFDSNNIEVAKKLLTNMKYYRSIETKIKEIKQKLNIPD
uniref:J domain-containing protein n=1 Tax=Graphocephala atropunctata TaxID=36148 RepID=A0A1B6KGD9_9HEMI